MNRNTQAMTPTAKAGWGLVIAGGRRQFGWLMMVLFAIQYSPIHEFELKIV
jgi:hypothetical protein